MDILARWLLSEADEKGIDLGMKVEERIYRIEDIVLIHNLKNRKRKRDFVDKRAVLSIYCKECLGMTATKIGEILNRDHATVLNSIKHAERMIETRDKVFFDNSREVKNKLLTIKNGRKWRIKNLNY